MQRSPQECHTASDGTPLRQIPNGLVHHRLQHGKRNIRLFRTIIHERLDIRLGKHAAAGCDGINLLSLFRQCIQPRRIRREQRCHMIDEGARSACADTVHALLRRIPEIRDLCILAAQFHHGIRPRNHLLHRRRACNDLLHKGQPDTLCNAHTRGASERKGKALLAHNPFQCLQIRRERRSDLRKMPCIILIDQFLLLIQNNQLDGRGTNIDSNVPY